MTKPDHSTARNRTLIGVPLVAAALVLVYALAGFLLLPWAVKRELPRMAEEKIHFRVRVGELAFNPFTLALRAKAFALDEIDGRPVLGFDEASVALEWRSVLRGAWVFSDIRVINPSVRVVISKQGRLNLAALAPATAGGAPSAGAARFAIGHLALANGRFEFLDEREGYRNRLEHLTLELSSISNLDAEKGPYALSAQTPGGAKLRWKGELALEPLAATGTLAIENLALSELNPYLDDLAAAQIASGHADLELPYRFALARGKPQLTVHGAKLATREFELGVPAGSPMSAKISSAALEAIDFDLQAQRASARALRVGGVALASAGSRTPFARLGSIALERIDLDLQALLAAARMLSVGDVALAAPGREAPNAALGSLVLEGIDLDFRARRAAAAALRVADVTLAAKRDAKGNFDLAQLLPALQRKSPDLESEPVAWQAEISAVEFANVSATYIDETAKTPLLVNLRGLGATLRLLAGRSKQGPGVRIDSGELNLVGLDAGAALQKQPAVTVAGIAVAGVRFDSGANALEIGSLRLAKAGADALLQDGRLSLLDLLPAAAEQKPEKPLAARLKSVELADGTLSVADHSSGIVIALENVGAKLIDVSADGAKPLTFELAARLKSGGKIAARGGAALAAGTLDADIEASEVALAPVAPLLARFATAKLAAGEASFAGMLKVRNGSPKLSFAGSASIANIALENESGARLVSWKSLGTESLSLTLAPNDVDIDELRWTAPAGKFAIAADHRTNIGRAFVRSGTAAAAAAGKDELESEEPGAFGLAIRRVRIEQGELDFADDSLRPGFAANIRELAGTANGLSSDRSTRSQFTLEGRINEFGFARLSGSLNPFDIRNRTNFRVQMRNVDLTSVSPYSMKFAGYRIASGHLGLDLRYRVHEGALDGDNQITLEQFTLGEHVESPDALKLPIELAIALLKDADGRIDLEVPVKGSFDDPLFDYGAIVRKAIGNLVTGIVSAPFRALARLFGGSGEEVGAIAFEPGSARLLPPGREKLGRMVKALAQRPELKVVIPAHYDSEADARALKRDALARDIARRAGFTVQDGESAGQINVDDRPTRAGLRAAFSERFSAAELDKLKAEVEVEMRDSGKPEGISVIERVRRLASGEPLVADPRGFYFTIVRRLRDARTIPASALEDLARRRAEAIAAALRSSGVDPARIAQTAGKPTSNAEAKEVKLELSLALR